jgi:hypothetical protein
MPQAVDDATERVYEMIQNLAVAILVIDKDLVRKWVEDLVITKTFTGLCFQESILKEIARRKGVSHRLANPHDESQGIDGYIGNTPVSVKPDTYKTKSMLHENIDAKMIYYEKLKDGIRVEYDL